MRFNGMGLSLPSPVWAAASGDHPGLTGEGVDPTHEGRMQARRLRYKSGYRALRYSRAKAGPS